MSGEEQGGGPRGRASALLPHPSPRRRGQGLVVSPVGIRGIFCLIRSSIYLFSAVLGVRCCVASLVAASGGCSLAAVCGLLIAVTPLLQSRGPGVRGLQ